MFRLGFWKFGAYVCKVHSLEGLTALSCSGFVATSALRSLPFLWVLEESGFLVLSWAK